MDGERLNRTGDNVLARGAAALTLRAGESHNAVPTMRSAQRRLLHRRSLSTLICALDAIAASILTLILTASIGVDILYVPLVVSLPFICIPLVALAGIHVAGGYRFPFEGSFLGHFSRVAVGAGASLASLALLVSGLGGEQGSTLTGVALANAVLLLALHTNYMGAIRGLSRAGRLADNVVIVGATPTAAQLVAANARQRDMNILGYFDDRTARAPADMGEAAFLGDIDDLLSWRDLAGVDRIIVTVTSTAQDRVRMLLDRLRQLPHEIILVLDLDGFQPEHTSLASIATAPAAYVSGAPRDMRRAMIKRAFDIVASSIITLFVAPVLLVAALLVRAGGKGPVLLGQQRHGFNNQLIRVWSFRTRSANGAEPAIGRFLRQTSLDQLPQLINVMAGQMSIVGPRPHALGLSAGALEVTRTVGEYAHRHRMKPGITGWAQVNGSRGPVQTRADIAERIRLDLEYVARANLWLDLRIIAKTFPRLFANRSRG